MKTVIITETQIKRVLDNLVSEGHNTKELKKLLSWAERKANCAVSDTKDGGRLCPPKSTGVPCYSFHRKDSAVEPIKNHINDDILLEWYKKHYPEDKLSHHYCKQNRKMWR